MNKILQCLFFNGLFATAIYYGFYDGVEGAKNVALTFACINIVISFAYFSDSFVEKMVEKNITRTIPRTVNAIYDIGVFASSVIRNVLLNISALIAESLRPLAWFWIRYHACARVWLRQE